MGADGPEHMAGDMGREPDVTDRIGALLPATARPGGRESGEVT